MNIFKILFKDIKDGIKALKESDGQYKTLVNSSPNAIVVHDKGKIIYMNPAAADLFGMVPLSEIEKINIYDFIREDYHPFIAKHMQSLLCNAVKTQLSEIKFIVATGKCIDAEMLSATIHYDGKEMIQSVIKDISKHKAAEKQVQYLSTHDELSGLYNRFYLDKQIQKFSGRREFNGGVMMLDIQGLKKINDAKGHPVGDKIIKSIANLIASEFREGDVVARIGEDKFCILLPNIPQDNVVVIAERLWQKINDEKINKVKDFRLGVSIGTAYAKIGKELDSALKTADEEMYKKLK